MSAPHTFRIQDYTIGWVCALFTELAAAQDMLDDRHDDTHVNNLDTNIYTLGSISGHNVVIACLPDGQMGVGSAAAVAAQMKSTFPSIQFGLMVGVGGGVPTVENDIRLGDVVVSRPDNGHGGVIQYDFGKNTPGGFQRTGFLNSPPQVLLKAISKIRSDHLRGEKKFLQFVSNLKVKIQRPGHDVLFEANSSHTGGSTCEKCNKSKIVKRKPRADQEIMIHYGTIASGSQVMRDGVDRDRLSSELGDVLCFEMEAAGLMNIIPCLVIRGICDYADSHKNKVWQRYAAMMAAAYAKELLSNIPASEVTSFLTTKDKAVHFHLLPGPNVCPYESIMILPYFGWSGDYVAAAIKAAAKVLRTLHENDDDDTFAEPKEFLCELKATLEDIQNYDVGFPSGQFTTDLTRLLQIIKSPLDGFLCFVVTKYNMLDVRSERSISDFRLWSNKPPSLSGKLMELKDVICHPLKLVRALLLLHNLERVVKLVKQELPVVDPDATNVAAKLISALNSIDISKLEVNIESFKSRQKYEKTTQLRIKSSNRDISSTLFARGRESTTRQQRSHEMVFAIEVLRQELHRSTGIIVDALISQMQNPSNDQDVKGLLDIHKQSFVTIHESLKSSWVALNEIEELIRQCKEQHTTENRSSWFVTGIASLLGAVIGSIATTVFGMSLKHTNEPQLCDISFLLRERDTSPSRPKKAGPCTWCEPANNRIIKNDAPGNVQGSGALGTRAQNTLHTVLEEPPLSPIESLPSQPNYVDDRGTPTMPLADSHDYLQRCNAQGPEQNYFLYPSTTPSPFFALPAYAASSSGNTDIVRLESVHHPKHKKNTTDDEFVLVRSSPKMKAERLPVW